MKKATVGRSLQFTVEELLTTPVMQEAKLLAGSSGVYKEVLRVNVMEVPDVLPWVRPGEFLVTTGYPFKENPQLFEQLIPELANRGVAALGIKTKRYLTTVPLQAIKAAERCGIPLIELPPNTVFSEVVREIMERVLVNESSHLVILQNRIQTISRLLLEGGGLHAFLDTLERMIGNPLAVVLPSGRPWLSAALRGAALNTELPYLSYELLGKSDGRGFRYTEEAYRHPYPNPYPIMAYGPKLLPMRLYVAEIPMHRRNNALLVLLERDGEITPVDALSLDRLSPLAGLELMNTEAVREVESKYVEQFVQDWFSGKLVTENDIRLRAEVCGCKLPMEGPFRAGIVRFKEGSPSTHQLLDIARQLRTARPAACPELLAAVVGGELAVLLPGAAAAASVGPKLLYCLRELCGSVELSLYTGGAMEQPEKLPDSYRQAGRAMQAADVSRLREDWVDYDGLGIYAVLYLIPRGEEWNAVMRKYIEPLLAIDSKGGRMLETLEAYFQCNANIRVTSELLFAHYNTIVYRLEKIESVLQVDLSRSETRLQLQLALKMHQMSEG